MAVTADVVTQEQSESSGGGWVEPAVTCKRHKWEGGSVCVRCGTLKPTSTPRIASASSTSSSDREPSDAVKKLRTGFGIGWTLFGAGIEQLPKRIPSLQALEPVGRVIQYEGPMAGVRIQQALRKTPAWKPVMAFMRQVGPWSDLLPLIVPPILVGVMAQWPKTRKTILTPILVGMMVQTVAETERLQAEQAEMLAQMNQFSEQNIEAAQGLLSQIFGETEEEDAES